MGLDGVELVMEFEESFGIVLSSDEAAAIRTVGDAYRCILLKLDVRRSSHCETARRFYQIRRVLMDQLGVARRAVRPSTPIERALCSWSVGRAST